MRVLRYYLPVSVLAAAIAGMTAGCAPPAVLLPPPQAVSDELPHLDDAEIAFDLKGIPASTPLLTEDLAVLTRLRSAHIDWDGTPYRFGGTTRDGIDCSAFVQRVFKERFGVRLTRATATQVHEGREIDRNELQAGDLVFFQTGRRQRHVGIYLHGGRFLHSSSRQGVTVDELNSGFYDRTYWTARRVLPPEVVASLIEPITESPVHLAVEQPKRELPQQPPTPPRRVESQSPPATSMDPGSQNSPRRSGW